jgi:hypothetical protein
MSKSPHYSLAAQRTHYGLTKRISNREGAGRSTTNPNFNMQEANAIVGRKLQEALGASIQGNYEDLRGQLVLVELVPADEKVGASYKLITTIDGRTCRRNLMIATQTGEKRPYMKNGPQLASMFKINIDALNQEGFRIAFVPQV